MNLEFSDMIGKPPFEAQFLHPGYTVRVTFNDGTPVIVTQDYNPKRINVKVVSGVITEVTGTG